MTSVGQCTPRYTREIPTSSATAIPKADNRGAPQLKTAAAAAVLLAWAGGRVRNAADGELRKAREGAAGSRVQALEQRAGPKGVRKHLAGGLEALARAFQDGHERVPARRRLGAGQPGPVRPGGEVLLR